MGVDFAQAEETIGWSGRQPTRMTWACCGNTSESGVDPTPRIAVRTITLCCGMKIMAWIKPETMEKALGDINSHRLTCSRFRIDRHDQNVTSEVHALVDGCSALLRIGVLIP